MSGATSEGGKSFLHPLRHTMFRNIWSANLVSNFGGIIQTTGAAWLMTIISNSTEQVALVQASASLPVLAFSLLAGAMADVFNRRTIMLCAQFFLLAVACSLVFTVAMGWITPWLLLTFTFLVGCGVAVNIPAWQSSVREFVPREDLPGAVALNSIAFNLSRSFAPALGGVIVAAFGAIAAFVANLISYVGILTVLLRWKPNFPKRTLPPERISSAMAAGLRYVAMSPQISRCCLRAFYYGFGGIAILALLPLVARDLIHGGARSYGVMYGAFGVGAVIAAMYNGWIRSRFTGEGLVRFGYVLLAAVLALTAISSNLWVSCLILALGGASWVWVFNLLNVTVQLSTPRWVLARALAIYQAASAAGFVSGSWASGWTAELFGTQNALFIFAGILTIGLLLGRYFPVPEQKELKLNPFNHWTPPPLSLDLKPSSGPIIIEIEYIIREEDIPEFLQLMGERRRMRMRDGASNWMLMRSLEESERWTVSYQLPTWVEYVRHNERMTEEDALLGPRILALHAGEESPLIRRMIERHTDWSSAYEERKPVQEFLQ